MTLRAFVMAVLLCLCICVGANAPRSYLLSSDTLTSDAGDVLVSSNGIFTLGFRGFPTADKSVVNLYLCIWYSSLIMADAKTPVITWTAGTTHPPAYTSAYLNLSSTGNLLIFGADNNLVWSAPNSNPASKAELLDTGNLVLLNASSGVLWQTFDSPTDTLLPSQSLKVHTSLTSWINRTNPMPGFFSLQMQGDQNLVLYYVATGSDIPIWDSSDSYTPGEPQGSPYAELDNDGAFVVHYFDGFGDNSTFLYKSSVDYGQKGVIRRFVLEPGGRLIMYSWNPRRNNWAVGWENPCSGRCVTYTATVGNTTSGGSNITIGGTYSNKTFTHGSHSNTTIGGGHSNTSSNLSRLSGRGSRADLFGRHRLGISLGSIVAAVTGVVVVAIVVYCGITKSRTATFVELQGLEVSGIQMLRSTATALPVVFSYKQLQRATDGFREKLGSGGFGSVYKGLLPNSCTVAVKRLENLNSSHGRRGFVTEVLTIGAIHHVNLVRLHGYCYEGPERMLLVYEFLENGSLDRFLFHHESGDESEKDGQHDHILDWPVRFKIALGTAQGIAYLHEQCRVSIIHCDIKPENILLAADFSPKVSDFGLAKLMSSGQSNTITIMRGTRGYLAPEWLADLPITVKSDVFSYGQMLLEIISGRRNLSTAVSLDKLYYPLWAFRKMVSGSVSDVVDVKLGDNYDQDQAELLLQVAFWCIQDEPSARPSMGRVVEMLQGKAPVLRPPLPHTIRLLMRDTNESEPLIEPTATE